MRSNKKRWIVKAGSSLVAGGDGGINNSFIENLVSQVNALLDRDIEVIIVSSGAVAKGMHELGLKERPSTLHLLQASAALGQMGLINAYQQEFDKFNLKAAQVLISHDDISDRKRYLNARRSLETLLELKVVPIVNENDSVATEEISFGDNDTLAGALSGLVNADRFIMLTDQEGICSEDPRSNPSAILLKEIDLVLIMSVNPGFGGQIFIENTFEKIHQLKKLIELKKSNANIEIDGGVTDQNAVKLIESGANILVAGSYIFKSNNPVNTIRNLTSIVN